VIVVGDGGVDDYSEAVQGATDDEHANCGM
jgi:hypothetical protein